ncbi:MAG: hypothetical protein GY757_15035, partial [bacterium]|nr:hypothetical protein [bacterium]
MIIGGGSAGVMAAIRVKEIDPNLDVVIIEKGDFEYGGSIPRGMDALNVVVVPGKTTVDDFVAVNRIYNEGVVDDPKSMALAERSWGMMQRLIGYGINFPKIDGEYDIVTLHPHKKFTVSM